VIKSCAGLIIASQKEQERVIQKYGLDRSKLRGIINPLDLRMWRPMNRAEARSRLSIAIDDQVVVWHGRVDIEHKGVDLLSAWKQICKNRPHRALRLVLVGSGQGTPRLRRLIHENNLTNVQWSGDYVHDIELIRCYLSAGDIYVLPSRIEGFAVAPMEAMAIGLPVVMSDVSGAAELLPAGADSGGFIVPVADPESLADAVCRLLDAPELCREMGKSARRRVEDWASLESVGRQLKEFIFWY
jgi:glycosyltransferase involved in cell wall biosynthesis